VVSATVYIALLVVSAVLTTGLGIYAYRHREEPGASAFVALMAILTNWSAVYAIGLSTTDEFWRILWLRTVWFSTGTIEVWLLLFALAYTGHDEFINRKTVAMLLVVPGLIIFATWTNPIHHLFWTEHNIVHSGGLVLVNPTWGVLFWVEVIYTYLLVAVASALLIRLIYQSDYLFTDQSALLLVGIATPFVASAADVFVFADQPAIDPTPFAFTVTGVAFAYALFRRQLFDMVPATRQLGRNAAISQLDAGVVIVDNANRIVYCNTAAEEVLECDAADAVGRDVELLVDESRLDFDTADALAEVERDGDVYEVRTSPITDRRDRRIGNTLVVHDVTARKEREQRLARQRDELETVNDLNAVIRGVNQALVSALSRGEIEETVCERVADADLYRTACIADMATWNGDADRWTVAGDTDRWGAGDGDASAGPPVVEGELGGGDGVDSGDAGDESTAQLVAGSDGEDGTWTVVPLVYGRTVYGALGLYTDRETVSDRERSVLGELGETIGHAINAVETRQLLSAETVVELELEVDDDSDPLVAASAEADATFELEGLVPAGEGGPVAYLLVSDADTATAREALDSVTRGAVRTVREGEEGLLEWTASGETPLGTLVDHGASVSEVRADGGRARYDLAIASDSNVRALVDHLDEQFDGTRVLSKREQTRAVEDVGELPGDGLEDLTDRQREVLEAAYRAGYFEWPRDSNAEEVAETLDISSATLHSHLRKAEGSILADMFDASREE
jgi:PAS domain S-box-containing protein